MTDLYLRAPDQATMHYAMRSTYEALTGNTLEAYQPTPAQAHFTTGGSWVVDDIGTFYEQTGTEETETGPQPIMTAREGYHIILRWNSGEPVPEPGPLEIVWRSDAVDGEGNPVPPPAWWNRVLA